MTIAAALVAGPHTAEWLRASTDVVHHLVAVNGAEVISLFPAPPKKSMEE